MIGGSLLVVCAPCARVITFAVTSCVSDLPHGPVRAYFARYLTVTVKICTLESILPVFSRCKGVLI